MSEVVIVSAVRTPIGKFQGSLQSYTSPQLGALVVREAVRRAAVEPAKIDDCIMGCVLQAGVGQARLVRPPSLPASHPKRARLP